VLLAVVPLVLGRTEGWPAWTWLSVAAPGSATHAFATVTAGFAAIAGLAALLARGTTRPAAVS
jgi:hypothetical protein